MIIVTPLSNGTFAVYLDRKRVGTIVDMKPGFQYRPRCNGTGGGKHWGEVFPTLAACKASL